MIYGGNILKLDIIGSVASGKTTFAREISIKYQIPFCEKDNVVWERTPNGDKKGILRSKTEFLEKL